MKLAILGSPTGRYSLQLLNAAQQDRDVEVTLCEFDRLSSSITSDRWTCQTGEGLELTAVDAILVRTMPVGTLDQIIFRVDLLHRLRESGVCVVNSPRCLEVSIDKYLTTVKLQQAGLPVPRTIACQHLDAAHEAFEKLGGDVVVKPLFGGEGRGILRVDSADLADRVFKTLLSLGQVLYLQEFVAHPGFDIRVFLLGDRVWSIRRRNDSDWRTNVSRGAVAEPIELDGAWLDLARRAAEAVGGWMVGVDLLPDREGKPLLLEVNAVPGWDGLAAAHQINMAEEVIAAIKSHVKLPPR